MRRTVLIALAMPIATPANAESYSLSLVASAGQIARYDRGIGQVDDVRPGSVVRVVEVAGADKKTASFMVEVYNSSDQSLDFGPANIVIRPAGAAPLPLITYEQAMTAERHKEKRENFWNKVGAMGRAMSANSAGQSYGTGTFNTAGSGFVGNTPVSGTAMGTYSYTADNPAVRLAAQRDAAAINRQSSADLAARQNMRAASFDTLLRRSTVDPRTVYGGVANFEVNDALRKARGPVPVTIEVTVLGETHTFAAQLTKAD